MTMVSDVTVAAYPRLLDAFAKFDRQRREDNATRAPLFNLFRLLRLENDEVRLHSKLLGHFLDPRGSHGQGTLFLNAFLNLVGRSQPRAAILSRCLNTSSWRVSTEKFTIKGNLDLVLEGRGDGLLCVIENKIWAGEGDEQLSRYRDWLELQRRFPTRLLFFLTPDGRSAETIADVGGYIRLSYKQDVRQWLEHTIPNIQAQQVKIVAQQYLDVVSGLEGEIL